jgi:predicted nucleic acid-binding protein
MNRIIITDTSCLIALSNINELQILPDLFHEIIITPEVSAEFGEKLPDWIKVTEAKNREKQADLEKILDSGEASSIALALESGNSLLLIDEIRGRRIAKSLNVEIIGTIGVIVLAEKKGIVKDVMSLIEKLISKGFRLSDTLIDKLNDEYGTKEKH